MENLAILAATFSIPVLIIGLQNLVEKTGDMIHVAKIKLHKKGII